MNRIVKRAIAATHVETPKGTRCVCKDTADFWDRIGRRDLAALPESQLPCMYLEALHVVQRAMWKRDHPAGPKRKPLTQCLVRYNDHFTHMRLRPTKGWKPESVSADEASRLHKKFKVPFFNSASA